MQYAPAEPAAASEPRPLEGISNIADSLERQADALDAYLERFNGPRPGELVKGGVEPSPPRGYRGEIDRLDSLVRRVGSITDLIARLG